MPSFNGETYKEICGYHIAVEPSSSNEGDIEDKLCHEQFHPIWIYCQLPEGKIRLLFDHMYVGSSRIYKVCLVEILGSL